MKKAWIQNGTIRDICEGDPFQTYHPDVAQWYYTDVPDDCQNGFMLLDGQWTAPPVVEEPYVAPQPLPPPVALVPTIISMKQARLALLGAGLYSAAQDAIANMAGPAGDQARIVWEYSATVERSSQLVANVSVALGIDDSHLDELFILADTL